MTFFHFGNCVALAYVPYLITYKFSGLSEYSTFYKCVYAGKNMEFFKEQSEKNFASSVFSFWKSGFYRRLLLSFHATDKNDDPRDFFPDIRVASWTPWHQGRVSQGVTV